MYGPFFHGGNTGSNPVGDAKPFQELAGTRGDFRRQKKAQLRLGSDQLALRSPLFSRISSTFSQARHEIGKQAGINPLAGIEQFRNRTHDGQDTPFSHIVTLSAKSVGSDGAGYHGSAAPG